jgi:hypothetical protein
MINQIDDSGWSEDYDRLIEIMKLGAVVCTIDFKFEPNDKTSVRDVAKTSYKPEGIEEGDDGTYEISVRGISYVTTWSEKAFKGACNKYRVRFLDIDRINQVICDLEEENDLLSRKPWTHHRKLDNNQTLPVPRLQITLTEHNPEYWEWLYIMVYQHADGVFVGVPIDKTESTGGHKFEDLESEQGVLFSLPYRSGYYIRRDSAQLNLPAYAVVRGRSYLLEKIEG